MGNMATMIRAHIIAQWCVYDLSKTALLAYPSHTNNCMDPDH